MKLASNGSGMGISRREAAAALGAAGALAALGLAGCSVPSVQEAPSEADAQGGKDNAAAQQHSEQVTAADGSRATSPIRWDWEGRWAAGEAEVEFDEAAQACSATVPYEPLWFEACEGDKVYLYEWTADGWTYAGEADGSAKVTYENLVGDYTLSGSADLQAITRFAVESVDADGAISATATWVADEKYQDRRELAVPMEGTVMSCAKPDGTHRVLATLDGWTDDGFYLGVSFVADDSMYGSESNTVKSIRLDYTIEERTYDGAYYVTGFNSMGDFEVVEDKKAAA